MKYASLLLVFVASLGNLWSQQADVFDEKVTTAGNIGATVTNLGTIGNAFSGSFNVLDYPSLEYPVNSGVEHVFDGGLWIGGIKNGQVSVSTGAVDDPSGYSPGKRGFEFSSKGPLQERSSLFDSPFLVRMHRLTKSMFLLLRTPLPVSAQVLPIFRSWTTSIHWMSQLSSVH